MLLKTLYLFLFLIIFQGIYAQNKPSLPAGKFTISGYINEKGSKENSAIFQRMSSVQQGIRMPFIGTSLRDEPALTVVGKWIDSLHD